MGTKSQITRRSLIAENLNWIKPVPLPARVNAKIRYGQGESPAKVHARPRGEVLVNFEKPQTAPAPGQAVVFFKRNVVLGGGWIRKVPE